MCEAVQQLGEHFEGRIEAILKCRELVADHPEEREEVKNVVMVLVDMVMLNLRRV